MNATKTVTALVLCAGLLASTGCNQNEQRIQELEKQVAGLTQENEHLSAELTSTKS